jgi:hypothetical protein
VNQRFASRSGNPKLCAGNEGDEGHDRWETMTTPGRSSSVSCSVVADSRAFSAARDAHVEALAEAHKRSCSDEYANSEVHIAKVYEDKAYAIAEVSHAIDRYLHLFMSAI